MSVQWYLLNSFLNRLYNINRIKKNHTLYLCIFPILTTINVLDDNRKKIILPFPISQIWCRLQLMVEINTQLKDVPIQSKLQKSPKLLSRPLIKLWGQVKKNISMSPPSLLIITWLRHWFALYIFILYYLAHCLINLL